MKNKKRLLSLSSAFFISMALVGPLPSLADEVILNKENTSGVYIRADKANDAEIYGVIEDFNPIEIKDEDKDWYQISYEDKDAYIGKSWFFRLRDAKLISPSNLKENPDSDSLNLTEDELGKGTSLTILDFDKDSDFVKVAYRSKKRYNRTVNKFLDDEGKDKDINEEGYVKLSSLDLSKEDKEEIEKIKKEYQKINESLLRQKEAERQAEDVIEYEEIYVTYLVDDNGDIIDDPSNDIGASIYNDAVEYVGSPYVFGGTSKTNGIDCSGLVLEVFAKYGLNLPHSAKMQAAYGEDVKLGEEKAGDLIFFGSSYDDIYHVAIADGFGNMVHAANPGQGVIVSPIYDTPFVIKRIFE
ncbi:C40 family peptidase [Anaerococcus sp. AGMB09787]|uniref:C40 family peptidase n=1 Tax=Anaerococcus sp. AGMB09787 TaxID=2922869 RepID=UPI001FAE83D6|nr:C40 family peptidase [Anaerococcus sp. AGMB09787]